MEMNYERYDYLPLNGYKNVFCQIQKVHNTSTDSLNVLHNNLVPYVEELMRLKPHWKFVASRMGGAVVGPDGTRGFAWGYVNIFENNEHIGEIDVAYAYRNGETILNYCYDNHRLSAKRQRGGWTKTSKLPKAVKEVVKSFRPRDMTEHVNERMRAVGNLVSTIHTLKWREFNAAFLNIQKQTPHFVMRYWDQLKPLIDEYGTTYSPDLPELYGKAKGTEHMLSDEKTLTIIVRGNEYIVVRTDGGDHKSTIMTSEELSAEVRGKLGMLKLSDVKHYVHNVGVRCAEDTYFILVGEDK